MACVIRISWTKLLVIILKLLLRGQLHAARQVGHRRDVTYKVSIIGGLGICENVAVSAPTTNET